MLTADYDRLGLQAGDRLLDLGCGFGRHAFEALRRGATVVACDMALPELVQVVGTAEAMRAAGEIAPGSSCTSVNGDATRLPFADASFDRIIASEVMEHVPDDLAALAELTRVLRPGGTIAITIPAELPERLCWRLSEEYHAPFVTGGHVRIYAERELRDKMRDAGLQPTGSHRAHALHTPYWWLRCAVGPTNDTNPLVRRYTKFLEWDIMTAPSITRTAERILNPVLGKSLVVYGTRPVVSVGAVRTTTTVGASA
ncbi:MAG: methyltransferase domain-containing protein [Acidobacteria bacterium]|nr:methyltransferase domain-containing protein [Acidobacteriota bacterium]